MGSSLEVADIFRQYGPAYRARYGAKMALVQKRAMRAIEVCRTAVLGGHVDRCDGCGQERISYNSCRNRHCPKCQGLDKERWLEARQDELLPIPYFHVVFTLPQALPVSAWGNPQAVYRLLFQTAAQTLLELSRERKYLGAQIGVLALLHTWSQMLAYHPHLHCIVTGGGLSEDGRYWRSSRSDFFLPVRVVSRLFRGKFLAGLRVGVQTGEVPLPEGMTRSAFGHLCTRLYTQEWVVYAKRPFAGPAKVLDYLARYTHRVALSNDRLIGLEDDQVTFRYRNRTDQQQVMRLPVLEFIRRFLQHVLPARFVKIRYYGLLSNRQRRASLAQCRRVLGYPSPPPRPRLTWQAWLQRLTGLDPTRCPHCQQGRMVVHRILPPTWARSPP